MNNNELFAVRQLTNDDLDAFNDLLRYAFQVTNRELMKTGWEIDEIKHEKAPILQLSYVIGWFHRTKLISQIVVYPMQVNIHGVIYPMGGITGVATYPEYTGRGLIHTLMQQCLEHMRGQGQTISYLYPYSIPFYRKKGWEIISDKLTFSVKDTQLPRLSKIPEQVERVSPDHADIKKIHDFFAKQRHGALIRDDLAWNEYWRWDVDDIVTAVYYDASHHPAGYIVYYLEKEIFNVKELVYLTHEAHQGLWNYVSAHFSMVTEVRGSNYTGDPLAFLFEDSEIKETIQPYIMARIVDFKPFILKYPFIIPAEDLQLNFKIEDPIAAWNQGNFAVHFINGKLNCAENAPCAAENTIEINIQTLAALLMGYKRPAYLHQHNRFTASPQTVQLLEKIIPAGKVYFSDFF